MKKRKYEEPDLEVHMYPAYGAIILTSPEEDDEENWGPLL